MSSTNHTSLCLKSLGSEDDWKDLYEASFPQDERMSVTEIRSLLSSGLMVLHKTTDAQGALQCFSLVTILSNFLLLAYIATDQTRRSSGVGSAHMKALIALLKTNYPNHIGLFLEIESTTEKNLSTSEEATRKRRLAFYQRLQCKQLVGREYLLPSYTPGTPAREGELLWFEFGGAVTGDTTLQSVIAEIYTRAYCLPVSDPSFIKVVGQFNAAVSNPSINPGPASGAATISPNTVMTKPASGPAPQ